MKKIKLYIPFRVWESASMASAKDDVRYYLNGVHIKAGRVESTNGHVAYMARLNDCAVPEFIDGVLPSKDGIIISPKNKVPKWSKKNQINHVVITINEKDADIEYLSFYGERVSSDIGVVVDGKFPNIPKIISTARKNKVDMSIPMGIRTEHLDLPNKMLSHCACPTVKMEIFGDDIAILMTMKRIELSGVKETLVIMPCRL